LTRETKKKILYVIVANCLFLTRALYAIYANGEALYPDTFEYANGSAYWSSPILALSGYTGGLQAVRIIGLFGTVLLATIFGITTYGKKRMGLRLLALYLLPPGWYTMQPAADALGAGLSLATLKTTRRNIILPLLGLVFSAHLVAGLITVLVLVLRRIGNRHDGAAGLVGGIAACLGEDHLQVRYFLPGLAVALT